MDLTLFSWLGVSVFVAVSVSALFNRWLDHNDKQKTQAHSRYMALFEQLQKRIITLEAANNECQQQNAELREEVGTLREAVRHLEEKSGEIEL